MSCNLLNKNKIKPFCTCNSISIGKTNKFKTATVVLIQSTGKVTFKIVQLHFVQCNREVSNMFFFKMTFKMFLINRINKYSIIEKQRKLKTNLQRRLTHFNNNRPIQVGKVVFLSFVPLN